MPSSCLPQGESIGNQTSFTPTQIEGYIFNSCHFIVWKKTLKAIRSIEDTKDGNQLSSHRENTSFPVAVITKTCFLWENQFGNKRPEGKGKKASRSIMKELLRKRRFNHQKNPSVPAISVCRSIMQMETDAERAWGRLKPEIAKFSLRTCSSSAMGGYREK